MKIFTNFSPNVGQEERENPGELKGEYKGCREINSQDFQAATNVDPCLGKWGGVFISRSSALGIL